MAAAIYKAHKPRREPPLLKTRRLGEKKNSSRILFLSLSFHSFGTRSSSLHCSCGCVEEPAVQGWELGCWWQRRQSCHKAFMGQMFQFLGCLFRQLRISETFGWSRKNRLKLFLYCIKIFVPFTLTYFQYVLFLFCLQRRSALKGVWFLGMTKFHW